MRNKWPKIAAKEVPWLRTIAVSTSSSPPDIDEHVLLYRWTYVGPVTPPQPVEVTIPILPQLDDVLADVQRSRIGPTFLVTQYGEAWKAASMSTMFKQWCKAAGLPDACKAHGLRKTFAKIAANARLTPHEIAALTGHRTLAEVTRYTAEFDRKNAATTGMQKIKAASVKPAE